jgi:hypothetical protein
MDVSILIMFLSATDKMPDHLELDLFVGAHGSANSVRPEAGHLKPPRVSLTAGGEILRGEVVVGTAGGEVADVWLGFPAGPDCELS